MSSQHGRCRSALGGAGAAALHRRVLGPGGGRGKSTQRRSGAEAQRSRGAERVLAGGQRKIDSSRAPVPRSVTAGTWGVRAPDCRAVQGTRDRARKAGIPRESRRLAVGQDQARLQPGPRSRSRRRSRADGPRPTAHGSLRAGNDWGESVSGIGRSGAALLESLPIPIPIPIEVRQGTSLAGHGHLCRSTGRHNERLGLPVAAPSEGRGRPRSRQPPTRRGPARRVASGNPKASFI